MTAFHTHVRDQLEAVIADARDDNYRVDDRTVANRCVQTLVLLGVLPETDAPAAAQVDGHPEDRCGRCGRPNVSWVVPSDRFNTACSRSEIVCPVCFVQAHEAATGMACTWEMVPATPFRWIDDEGRPTPFEPVAAQVDGDLVTRLRRWRNVASAVDAHEAADEIERLRELTAGEDFLLDAQADVIAGLQAEIERLRAALSLTVAALDDILRRAWIDCHPGRPAKAMLNPADLSRWESWQTTLAETREVLGDE